MSGNGHSVSTQHNQESVPNAKRAVAQLCHDEIMAGKSCVFYCSHSQSSRLGHFPHQKYLPPYPVLGECFYFNGSNSAGWAQRHIIRPQQTETHDSYFNVFYKIPSVDLEWYSRMVSNLIPKRFF